MEFFIYYMHDGCAHLMFSEFNGMCVHFLSKTYSENFTFTSFWHYEKSSWQSLPQIHAMHKANSATHHWTRQWNREKKTSQKGRPDTDSSKAPESEISGVVCVWQGHSFVRENKYWNSTFNERGENMFSRFISFRSFFSLHIFLLGAFLHFGFVAPQPHLM